MKPAMAKIGATSTGLKRSRASLFGGIATGIGVLALYMSLTGESTAANVVIGLVIGGVIGLWVWLADL